VILKRFKASTNWASFLTSTRFFLIFFSARRALRMLSWDLAILFCIYVNNCWNLGDVRATYFIIAVVGAREFWEEFTQALGVARKIFLIFGVWWRVGRSCMIWWADSSEGGVKIRTYPFCALVDDCALILIGCLCGMRNIFVECFVLVGSTVDNIGSGSWDCGLDC
jgi:hypothetical protein